MASRKNASNFTGSHQQLLHHLAVVACGAVSGAAVLLTIGSLTHRWLSVTPSQGPLALSGGLIGAGAVLIALALAPSGVEKEMERDGAPGWMESDPSLKILMTWTPSPVIIPFGAEQKSRARTARRRIAATRRCSVRQRGLSNGVRHSTRPARTLPRMEA